MAPPQREPKPTQRTSTAWSFLRKRSKRYVQDVKREDLLSPRQPVPNLRGIFVQPANIRVLKAGDILRAIPESEVEHDMQFNFEVSFDEPGVITGEPIIEMLQQMLKLVNSIILAFEPGLDVLLKV
jgi:hypothetical protein